MNIWIYPTCNEASSEWLPSLPPSKLQILRPDAKADPYSFTICKESMGTCLFKLQLPDLQMAVSELTERQARSLGIACLTRASAWGALRATSTLEDVSLVLEQLADEPGLESGAAMFPEWFRANYRTTPECMKKAAECLRSRRLSAGSGIKVVVAGDADFADESRADIILSGTSQVRKSADADLELRKALLARAGIILLGAVCAFGMVKLVSRK